MEENDRSYFKCRIRLLQLNIYIQNKYHHLRKKLCCEFLEEKKTKFQVLKYLPDFLQTLEVLTEFLVDDLRGDLRRLACLPVFLSVQEPVGDLELPRVLDDSHELFDLVSRHLSRPRYLEEAIVAISTTRAVQKTITNVNN